MNKQKIYTVKDKKAEAFLQPFTTQTDGLAIRMIQASMEQENNLSKYPEDFSLWCIGEFLEETGLVLGYEDIICLGQLSDLNTKK